MGGIVGPGDVDFRSRNGPKTRCEAPKGKRQDLLNDKARPLSPGSRAAGSHKPWRPAAFRALDR